MSTCQEIPADTIACINISLIQGNPKVIPITLQKVIDDIPTPIDLREFEDIRMTIRGVRGPSPHGDVVKSITNQQLLIGGDNFNILYITFQEGETFTWLPYNARHDILFIKTLAPRIFNHWFKGIVKIEPTITTSAQ